MPLNLSHGFAALLRNRPHPPFKSNQDKLITHGVHVPKRFVTPFCFVFLFFSLSLCKEQLEEESKIKDVAWRHYVEMLLMRRLKGCGVVSCSEQSRGHFPPPPLFKIQNHKLQSPVSDNEVLIPWLWWWMRRRMGSSQTGTPAQTLDANARETKQWAKSNG